MAIKLPIGVDDFRKLRQGGYWYADKSAMIGELVSPEPETTVLPRPRRFGKTLAMSMLRCWFEPGPEDRSALFEDLEVWGLGEEVRSTFGRHPVILLSFKDIKEDTWEECYLGIRAEIAQEVQRLAYVRAGLSGEDAALFDALEAGSASPTDTKRALLHLSRWLHAHHGHPAVILTDEYDTPIHAGFSHGFYEEVVGFLRVFLSKGYKGNPSLYRGCLTGILHVAKEGLFSGLNNTSTFGVTHPRYAPYFGFDEGDVTRLLGELGELDRLPEVRAWYDGYLFGNDRAVYNPWSVLRYASDLPKYPEPYWKNTSGDDVLRELLMNRAVLAAVDVEELLAGGSVWKTITGHVVLRDAYRQPDAAWELLLHAGYLKAVEVRPDPSGRLERRLMIPNQELHIAFEDAVRQWTQLALGGREPLDAMLTAMLEGDVELFEDLLGQLAEQTMSYHDLPHRDAERVFQAFLLGMLVQLAPRYLVRSNREAGYGRADILLSPREPGGVGVVIELKRVRARQTPESALDEALAQITSRDYAAELRAQGCATVQSYGAAIQGKRVWVRRGA